MKLGPARQVFRRQKFQVDDDQLYQFAFLEPSERQEKIWDSWTWHLYKYGLGEITLLEFYQNNHVISTDNKTFYDKILNKKSFPISPLSVPVRLVEPGRKNYYFYQTLPEIQRKNFIYLPYSKLNELEKANFIIFGETSEEFIFPFHDKIGYYFEETFPFKFFQSFYPFLPSEMLISAELLHLSVLNFLKWVDLKVPLEKVLDYLQGREYQSEFFRNLGYLLPHKIYRPDTEYTLSSTDKNLILSFENFQVLKRL